jgi:DNA-binding SARP family transcriptional activator
MLPVGADDNIEKMVKEYRQLHKSLIEEKKVRQADFITDIIRKHLIISCASHLETVVQKLMSKLVKSNTANQMIHNLVQRKVIDRQYHTYFEWTSKNANKFHALFGDSFKCAIEQQISNKSLKEAVRAFIELGNLRNQLAHENYIEYQLQNTVDEILDLYKQAKQYVKLVSEMFGFESGFAHS